MNDEERRNKKMKMIKKRALKVKATAKKSLHTHTHTKDVYKLELHSNSTYIRIHACMVCFHHSLSTAMLLQFPTKVVFSCSQFSLAKAFLIPEKK